MVVDSVKISDVALSKRHVWSPLILLYLVAKISLYSSHDDK